MTTSLDRLQRVRLVAIRPDLVLMAVPFLARRMVTQPLAAMAASLGLAIVVTRWAGLPPLVASLLALPTFLILPLLIGERARGLLASLFGAARSESVAVRILSSWMIGTLAIVGVMLLFQAAASRWAVAHLYVIVGTLALASGLWDLFTASQPRSWVETLVHRTDPGALGAALLGLVLAGLGKIATPFPEIEYDHTVPQLLIQPATRIMEDGVLMWANPSHKPALAILVALTSQLHGISPLDLVWAMPFLLYPVFAVGIYLLASRLTRNSLTSLVAVAFGLLVISSNPFFGAGPLRIRTNVVQEVLSPLIAFAILGAPSMRRDVSITRSLSVPLVVGLLLLVVVAAIDLPTRVGLSAIDAAPIYYGTLLATFFVAAGVSRLLTPPDRKTFLILVLSLELFFTLHNFHTPLYFALLLVLFPLSWVALHRRVYKLPLVVASRFSVLPIVLACAALVLALVATKTSIADSVPQFSEFLLAQESGGLPADQRFHELLDSSGKVAVALFAASMFFLAWSREPQWRLLSMAGAAGALMFFLPDEFFYRAREVWIPFVGVALAVAVMLPANLVRGRWGDWWGLPASAVLFAVVWWPMLHSFYDFYSFRQEGTDSLSIVSAEEFEVAEWIHEQGTNARVISDFQTMHVVGALANTVGVVDENMNPQSHTDEGKRLVSMLHGEILNAPTPIHAYRWIATLASSAPPRELDFARQAGLDGEPVVYLVIGGKTERWADEPGVKPIRTPVPEPPSMAFTARFEDPRLFKRVWQGDSYIVFEVIGLFAPAGVEQDAGT